MGVAVRSAAVVACLVGVWAASRPSHAQCIPALQPGRGSPTDYQPRENGRYCEGTPAMPFDAKAVVATRCRAVGYFMKREMPDPRNVDVWSVTWIRPPDECSWGDAKVAIRAEATGRGPGYRLDSSEIAIHDAAFEWGTAVLRGLMEHGGGANAFRFLSVHVTVASKGTGDDEQLLPAIINPQGADSANGGAQVTLVLSLANEAVLTKVRLAAHKVEPGSGPGPLFFEFATPIEPNNNKLLQIIIEEAKPV